MNELEVNLTPLMRQYHQIKQQYKDCILMFRLGDFYEMFGEDAIKSSPILGIVLTKRQDIPMCGVPFHSLNNYISKLLNHGFKVAICEQVEDPKLAKGVVKREVVRVITPGTIIEENLLEAKKNNFLTSINIIPAKDNYLVGIVYVDISTGDFLATQFEDKDFTKTIDEINRISPSEIVAKETQKEQILHIIKQYKDIHIEFLEDWYFDPSTAEEKIKQFYKVYSLETFGISPSHYAILSSIGGLYEYLERTQKTLIPKLKGIKVYSLENYMFLNTACVRNLELIENLYDRTSKNSLLDVIDLTQTPMGARLLRNWILKPLLNIQEIKIRQFYVEIFYRDDYLRQKIIEKMKSISDIERITNKISSKNANPKDLINLKDSLSVVPEIKHLINQIIYNSQLNLDFIDHLGILSLNELKEVVDLIENSINPEAPVDIKKGNVIKAGYNKELDDLRQLYSSSKEWLLKYQEEQRQKTGITSLKIGYTSVFGYYIEVTKPNLHLIPKEYIRKQTLKNAERFITPELKEFEDKIISAEERILQLEEFIYNQIIEKISEYTNYLYEISSKIALIDVLTDLAEIARRYNYTKPVIEDSYILELKSSRHPVLERILPAGKFIPNDVYLDAEKVKLIILTGPNMAGKSTYIRQVALCVILAQIGSFVPAEYARIGIVDKIFARIGAADYLSKGLSTFMVEMQETANILHNATARSLIILDEIGRGTSTYDGISIAWSTIEYLIDSQNWDKVYSPRTLFATHYFELTELEAKYNGIKNYNVAVKEFKDEIVFLYKVIEGCSDKSYGIHVAKLAGIPEKVIKRSYTLLKQLQNSTSKINIENIHKSNQLQLDLFDIIDTTILHKKILEQLLEEIKKIDINNLTPLEAFNIILKWKKVIATQELKKENTKD